MSARDTAAHDEFMVAVGDRLEGDPFAVMLDVDGTLAPIAPTPTDAQVPEATRETLRRLVDVPNITLALVSGRSAADAWRLAGVPGAWVIGNHGLELRTPEGELTADQRVADFERAITSAADILAREFRGVPGAIVENKRWTLSFHYRTVDASLVPRLTSRADEVATALGLRVFEGKKIVELRPPVAADKGSASVAFAQRVGALRPGAAAMYAGDDRTDEDAFRALRAANPRAVTIRIVPVEDRANASSDAEFTLASTEELRVVLEMLIARRSRDTRRAD